MSHDVEIQNYQANREALMKNWQPVTKPIQAETSPLPTQEAVVSKAQFLGEFINNSDKKLV